MDCGYSLGPPRRGGSNEYPNLCFEQKYEKYQNYYLKIFRLLEVKFSIYFNRRVFVMCIPIAYSESTDDWKKEMADIGKLNGLTKLYFHLCICIVELQWLERLLDHRNFF